MLNALKNLFLGCDNQKSNQADEIEKIQNDELQIQLATCAIFLEIANSDDDFSQIERSKVIEIMKKTFNISEENVNELIEHSEKLIQKSVSLYEFTEIIDKNFNRNQKYKIIENIWRIILADNVINQYEEYFVRKVSNNLNMPHSDLIAAKFAVKEELKKATS